MDRPSGENSDERRDDATADPLAFGASVSNTEPAKAPERDNLVDRNCADEAGRTDTAGEPVSGEVDAANSGQENASAAERKPGEKKKENEKEPGTDEAKDENGTKDAKGEDQKGCLQRVSECFRLVRGIVTDALLLLVSVCGLALIIYGFSTKAVILDQIEIPKPLEAKGITSSFVSRRLADEVQRIQAKSSEKTSSKKLFEPSWQQEDIQVPGGNLSFRTMLLFFKKEFGTPDTHIEGSIFQPSEETIALVLRITELDKIFISGPYPVNKFDELIRQGGEEIVRMTDPYVLASYWFQLESKNALYPNALKWIRYSLVNAYDASASRAYNLWGNVLNNQGRRDEAQDKYKISTQQKSPFAEAHANLADVFLSKGDLQEAEREYEIAIKMDPNFSSGHVGWANALFRRGRYRESIDHAVTAIRLNPKSLWALIGLADAYLATGKRRQALERYRAVVREAEIQTFEVEQRVDFGDVDTEMADVYVAWGYALLSLEVPAEALEKYKKAALIDPTSADAFNGWGIALAQLRPTEAIDLYRTAAKLNPSSSWPHYNWGLALSDLVFRC